MKPLILLCFLIFVGKLTAQTYVSFPTTAIWYQVEEFQTHPLDYYAVNTFFTLNGDTIIANINYRKLTQTLRGQTDYVGAIRENQQKTVFFYAKTDSTERLLYKFGLSVGDSLNIRRNAAQNPIKVLAIDSVLIGNNFRKRYLMNTPTLGVKDYWIEGIGSTKGLFYTQSGQEFENQATLLCFYNNNLLEYKNSRAASNCTVANEELRFSNVHVYPNPVNNRLKFDVANTETALSKIVIFDMFGRILIQKQVENSSLSFEINIENLSNGVYFYTLSHQNRQQTGKFVVQR